MVSCEVVFTWNFKVIAATSVYMVIPLFYNVHSLVRIFSCVISTHKRAHVENTSGFLRTALLEIRKLLFLPNQHGDPCFLFCILKEDLILCDISQFDGLFIVQIFTQDLRSGKVIGLKLVFRPMVSQIEGFGLLFFIFES